ncbi:MAG: SDR family oxidoreductase [Firmicutes bacterium]|nr:SDR family oxidoreductase [Bacillota bacterium]
MGKNYFLTGATGFVGRYILKELLKRDSTSRIFLLARESGGVSGRAKMDDLLRAMFPAAEYAEHARRIEVLEGDVSLENFGLSGAAYQRLAETVNIIFHAAASIKFDMPLEAAARINVAGTQSVLKLAEKCMELGVLERMNHISTAYVTGKQQKPQGKIAAIEFANTYEQTKSIAEKLAGDYIRNGLPVTVYRPSIIFGHSVTGEITTGNILYLFMLLFSRKMIPSFPCGPDSSLNIITLNYFIDLLFTIAGLPESVGRAYNITNAGNTNMRELITLACEELGVKVPDFTPIGRMEALDPKVREQLAPFINYIEQSHYFDLSETRQLLANNSLSLDSFCAVNNIKACLKTVIAYCYDHRLLRKRRRSGAGDDGSEKSRRNG